MDLILNATFETPEVRFIESTGEFLLKGRMISNSSNGFWTNVQTWIADEIPTFKSDIILIVDVEYINAYSVTQLLTVISSLNTIKTRDFNFGIQWIERNDDSNESILVGQDIAAAVNCSFEFVSSVESCN